MRQLKLPSKPRRAARPVIGLDIEPGAVHVVEAIPGPDGRPVVQRAAMQRLEPGAIRDGEIVDATAVTDAVKAVFEEHGFDKHVRIGVANQRVLIRTVDLPPITDPKELAQAIRFQAPTEVPMPLDQAVLDYVSLGLVDTPEGPRTRVVLVAARRDMIEKLLSVAREAGLRPEGIDLAAFALVRSLAAPADETVAYLSLGGVVNLVVGRGSTCLFTRVIGGGMEAMAVELAERRGVPFSEARDALIAAGLELEAPVPTFEPVDPVIAEAKHILADGVRRIGGEVRASLDFHRGEIGGDTPVQRVVLTGAALAVPGVAEALSARIGLPVEAGVVSGPDGMEPGRYAVAAGLALEEIAA